LLERLGYRALAAGSGAEALAMAREAGGAVRVLLSDVVMPGLRGPELAAAFRAEWPGRPVILMSGYLDDAVGAPGAADAYLPKPITARELGAALRAVLDRAATGP
jgi:CheY-like chemotaxis protein